MPTTLTASNDLLRAERELAAIAERTRVGQRLDSDDYAEATLNRVAERAREELLDVDPIAAPPAPIILVTTGHPTLHHHPGPNGERVHPRLGRLIQPRHTSSIELTAAAGIPWAADNDCFQGLDEVAFVRMLDRIAGLPGCLFATVPDVVGDASATLAMFERWAPELERRGIPAGYVAQDGATVESTPWERIAAVFIGGTDDYKLGPNAARLAREAKRRGKWVHWGRVNTRKRFDLIRATGAADSFDGSKWARWRKTYLPTALEWLEVAVAERLEALEGIVARRRQARTVVVDGRELVAVAGGTNEFDKPTASTITKAAELLVLDAYNEHREAKGHDYGAGQRAGELLRRRRELAPGAPVTAYVLAERESVRVDGATLIPGTTELAEAARRLLMPRIQRVEREDYRRSTPSTRRTLEALWEVLEYFKADDERARRGIPRQAGGTNEFDGREPYVGDGVDGCRRSARIDLEERDTLSVEDPRYARLEASAAAWGRQAVAMLDELVVKVAAERERELADARRIGEEYERTGAYITGQAAASCSRRAEGLEAVLGYVGRLRAAGDLRIAELVLKGTLGDKAAARAAKAYSTDSALEAAERASAEADYTDGGSSAPQRSTEPAPARSLFDV